MDLIVNPEVRRTFEIRSKFISHVRRYLDSRGYMEVETPVLNTISGGASARPGVRPPDRTVTEAAMLAAFYSQAKNGQNVPVDVTQVRNLRKPNGAKPGMVVYDRYQTVIVTPDPELPEKLRAGAK